MRVILLETDESLGAIGEVINVKPGYARNFLLPRGKAMLANERNLKHLNHGRRILEHKIKRIQEASEDLVKKVDGKKLKIVRKSSAEEKLFGSVTAMDVEQAIKQEFGVEVSRRGIGLAEPIKKIGKYPIVLKLDGGLEATVKLEVAAEEA